MHNMLGVTLLMAFSPTVSGAIQLPSHIASSMVIQRNQPFELKGTDAPHAKLSVDFLGTVYGGVADVNGQFSISLPPQKESTAPTTITIESSSGSAPAHLVDILFGDVFISSGQSNMVR